MKTLIVIMFLPILSFAQDLPKNSEGKIEYTAVVQIDTAKAATLFSNAKLFIADAFKSAKDVTQLDDANAKTVMAKGLMPVSVKSLGSNWDYGYVRFQLTIQCKDGRYKYSFTDFVHEDKPGQRHADGGPLENEKPGCGTMQLSKKYWENIKKETDETTKAMIEDLKKHMASPNNNW
jgi:hypothetical protein